MLFLDLFSGIGGFSLGLERAGMKTIAFCEFAEYPRSILKKHWPDVPISNDIRKLTYNFKTKQLWHKTKVIYVGSIELICGGFPCQPFSVAGKQEGKEDDRHLWPEMFRLIKEVRPRWVIGENVAGFISMALDDVLFDLESEGYETQSFVVPACAVGAIHRRDRVWIVANSQSLRNKKQRQTFSGKNSIPQEGARESNKQDDMAATRQASISPNPEHNGASTTKEPGSKRQTILNDQERPHETGEPERVCSPANVADSQNERLQRIGPGPNFGEKKTTFSRSGFARSDCQAYYRPIEPPTQPPVRHRDDGLPDNVARLKALGNAVVPQIPELIGRAIMEIEALKAFTITTKL